MVEVSNWFQYCLSAPMMTYLRTRTNRALSIMLLQSFSMWKNAAIAISSWVLLLARTSYWYHTMETSIESWFSWWPLRWMNHLFVTITTGKPRAFDEPLEREEILLSQVSGRALALTIAGVSPFLCENSILLPLHHKISCSILGPIVGGCLLNAPVV